MLDVKFGRAALYKDLDSARELAKLLVRPPPSTTATVIIITTITTPTSTITTNTITASSVTSSTNTTSGFFLSASQPVCPSFQVEVGNRLGMRVAAVLSHMESTIGQKVGNSLEVVESLETLKGRGPDNLMELVTTLGEDHHNTFNYILLFLKI